MTPSLIHLSGCIITTIAVLFRLDSRMLEGKLHMANHPAENTEERAAYNELNTELAKELKPLLEEDKELAAGPLTSIPAN